MMAASLIQATAWRILQGACEVLMIPPEADSNMPLWVWEPTEASAPFIILWCFSKSGLKLGLPYPWFLLSPFSSSLLDWITWNGKCVIKYGQFHMACEETHFCDMFCTWGHQSMIALWHLTGGLYKFLNPSYLTKQLTYSPVNQTAVY